MNYELARQLKDAGFEQRNDLLDFEFNKEPLHEVGYHLLRENGDSYDEFNDRTMYLYYFSEDYVKGEGTKYIVYIPTLEELIDACGDELHIISRNKQEGWSAYNHEEGYYSEKTSIRTTGKTPTESVAKLWLELNK